MSTLYELLEESVTSLIAEGKAILADRRVTISEASTFTSKAAMTLIRVADGLVPATGAEKKDAVMQAVGKIYDAVIAPIDLPGIPNLIEPMVDRAARPVVLAIVSGLVEALVGDYVETGVLKR